MDRMQHCHQLVFPGHKPIVRKGHMEPIDLSVASRGSNKKVTLIKNLELYGLDPAAIATVLQQRVQASTVLKPCTGLQGPSSDPGPREPGPASRETAARSVPNSTQVHPRTGESTETRQEEMKLKHLITSPAAV
ncbi:hypothetical protein SKAU_G00109630 [Synaphobranchus kaupii]|uniref:SUI1 domain-containing protein n=1 Tax=Synaphobranchus kaupii TaxID=118154 RepID=A0A9Q1J632_SYNKA|nr:hypothetical protein SKAU_G00109630 [Synaphobranchus kaupii]